MARDEATRRRTLEARYAAMSRIRAFEETVSRAHRDGHLPGLLHLSIGGEAVAVGVTAALGPDDRLYSSHRGHGHFLASGTDSGALMAELAGREHGLCRGRGGSMHLMDERAVLATGVVGGSLPIAVGHSLALPRGTVTVVFFGDGAAQTGVFHEALNLAALWEAPVLFVCENNGWAEFTAREEHTRVEHVVDHAELQGVPHADCDGSDVEAVGDATAELLEGVRHGSGAAMLECRVTRIRPHYEGDRRRDHDADARDPITMTRDRLLDLGSDPDKLDRLDEGVARAAEEALHAALAGPSADPALDPGLVFAAPPP